MLSKSNSFIVCCYIICNICNGHILLFQYAITYCEAITYAFSSKNIACCVGRQVFLITIWMKGNAAVKDKTSRRSKMTNIFREVIKKSFLATTLNDILIGMNRKMYCNEFFAFVYSEQCLQWIIWRADPLSVCQFDQQKTINVVFANN